VHGIALDEKSGRGFTSNGRESTVTIFDLKTLKTISKVKTTGENPDAIIFDGASGRVFTFNGRSSNATAINAASGKVEGTIPLDGKPEFAAVDGKGNVFVNIEDKSELTLIDSNALKVKSVWKLAPCESPSGLAIDGEHEVLFAGCDNKMMAMVDGNSGKVLAHLPIGEGVDATRYDPGTNLAFASCGEGVLTVLREESAAKFSVAENVKTERGARTMALDPKTHNVYLVTAKFGPRPAPTAENPHPRPAIEPGSFVLLVYGK
jgi:DNA-binding beta-propeller fold protein YncE